MRRRMLVLLLIMAMIFTAMTLGRCSEETGTDEIFESHYIESKIASPKECNNIIDLKLTEVGSLMAIGTTGDDYHPDLCLWESTDEGVSWELLEVLSDRINIKKEDFELVEFNGQFNPDGTIFMYYGCMKKREQAAWSFEGRSPYDERGYYSIDKDGIITELDTNVPQSSDPSIEVYSFFCTHYTDNYKYFEDGVGQLFYIDEVNNKSVPFGKPTQLNIYAFEGDTAYYVGDKDCDIMNPNEKDDVDKLKQLTGAYNKNEEDAGYNGLDVYENDNERQYYLVNNNGLWRTSDEGLKKLVDGGHSHIGGDLSGRKVIVKDENTIYLDLNGELYKYTYSEEPLIVETTLSAYIPFGGEKAEIVSKLINEYQMANPKIQIDLEVGTNDENALAADVIKKFNTKMLAGEGPDIVFFDGMDPKKYADEGLLADISEELRIDEAEYIGGESAGLRDNGSVYAFPSSCSFFAISSNEKDVKQQENLNSFADSLEKNDIAGDWFPYTAGILYREYFDGICMEDGNITEEELRDFYESIGRVADTFEHGYISSGVSEMSPTSMNFFTDLGSEAGGRISLDYITNFTSLQQMYIDREKGIYNIDFFGIDGRRLYVPGTVVGVNKGSKNLQEAKDFISYVFSEEGQVTISKLGMIPVSLDAFPTGMATVEGDIIVSSGSYYETRTFYSDEVSETVEMMRSMSIPVGSDAELMELVMVGAEKYLDNRNDLDKAVSDTMEKIKIYLAE